MYSEHKHTQTTFGRYKLEKRRYKNRGLIDPQFLLQSLEAVTVIIYPVALIQQQCKRVTKVEKGLPRCLPGTLREIYIHH